MPVNYARKFVIDFNGKFFIFYIPQIFKNKNELKKMALVILNKPLSLEKRIVMNLSTQWVMSLVPSLIMALVRPRLQLCLLLTCSVALKIHYLELDLGWWALGIVVSSVIALTWSWSCIFYSSKVRVEKAENDKRMRKRKSLNLKISSTSKAWTMSWFLKQIQVMVKGFWF